MQRATTLFLILFTTTFLFAQTAENYFPATPGEKLFYEIVPLDSLNNPVYSLTTVKADSFVTEGSFYGKSSKLLLSKLGTYGSIGNLPWSDSSFIAFEGSNASLFYALQNYLSPGDSPDSPDLGQWLTFYKFASGAGSSYNILTFDTTIVYNDQTIPLRYKLSGKRLSDEIVTTGIGEFTAKKFEIKIGMYYLLELPPPFPPLEVQIVAITNKVWIAQNNWIVKEYQPSVVVDISEYFPIPPFVIPGLQKTRIPEPTLVLALQFPNGGETFYAGYSHTILWNSVDVNSVNIEYSTDAGNSWALIAENYPAEQGIYLWEVPATYSNQSLVKIYDSNNSNLSDVSFDFFTISDGTPQSWTASIQVYNSPENIKITGFGQNPQATDGIDELLFENALDPPAPNTLDARFVLPQDTGESLLDYRHNSLTSITWELRFQPEIPGETLTFFWQPLLLPDGSFTLKDINGGSTVNIDMKSSSSVIISGYDFDTFYIIFENEVNNSATVNVSTGWNIISAPLEMENMNVENLFPDAASNAFGFEGSYIQVDELNTGEGYWLKFNEPIEYQFEGSLPEANITLNEGWNIIGVYNSPVSTSAISTEPQNILESPFFGFDNGYSASETLLPGKGYWIKSSGEGELILNSRVVNKIKFTPEDVDIVYVKDASGYVSKLYLSEQSLPYAGMPPMPPSGIPDVRFADNTFISQPDNIILLRDLIYPVEISCSESNILLSIPGETKSGSNHLVLSSPVEKILVGTSLFPTKYVLEQNYPNPFNPTTSISFSLPTESKVTLLIFNLLGEVVMAPVDQIMESGQHTIEINANQLASGTYFYRLSANEHILTKKMILLK